MTDIMHRKEQEIKLDIIPRAFMPLFHVLCRHGICAQQGTTGKSHPVFSSRVTCESCFLCPFPVSSSR